MLVPMKVIDHELTRPPRAVEDLDGYVAVRVLARLHGEPVGYVDVPVIDGRCPATVIRSPVLEKHSPAILRHLMSWGLAAPHTSKLRIEDLVNIPPVAYGGPFPLVTVTVCTRDRTADLAVCLDSLSQLDYPALDLLVVDNAPSSETTEQLVRTTYPDVRYVREPRPGLDWARNRAIVEARGEIIAYTDDDVVVDPGWITALVRVFTEAPEAMAITGLVVPYELETEAQVLFEEYGGFGRGFQRFWYHLDQESGERWTYYGAGRYGTGANMAYRRSLFEQIGYFDPALDVGTVTNGGGDLEMFFRVLKEGHTLVYQPSAVVRHRHRRDYAQLRTQLRNHGIGFSAYLVRSALAYPSERSAIARLGMWYIRWWILRRLARSLVRPTWYPYRLVLDELQGAIIGLRRYQKARRTAARIVDTFGPLVQTDVRREHAPPRELHPREPYRVGVRTVELSQSLSALTDVDGYKAVWVFVMREGEPLGKAVIENHCQPISAIRLRDAIVDHPGPRLLGLASDSGVEAAGVKALDLLRQRYLPAEDAEQPLTPSRLRADIPVSIVVCTYDRPDDLRECLSCLVAQDSPRRVEIIVVDNNPSSGRTPPVMEDFPGVVLVSEPRQGLSYARNRGIVASSGDIVVTTDDDATMPSDWLEKLLVPFARSNVMIVTGNVLPLELETPAQRAFEEYGGLGRGFEPREVDSAWFQCFRRRSVPTWDLGATANAAFRASIFSHPQIGLFDEALGAGSPTGCSEDTYLFYLVLKAGYAIAYQPASYVWHKHRREMSALRRQIYNYSKGHVAYLLSTLLQHHDLRAVTRLCWRLPRWHLQQIYRQSKAKLLGWRRGYSFSLTLLEIAGSLVGPWALWRSRRRVKRLGRSQPYIPVAERPLGAEVQSGGGDRYPEEAYRRRSASAPSA
jgi:GT2 family glycosyltransferase